MKTLKSVMVCRWFCLQGEEAQPVDCFVQERILTEALVIFVSFVSLWPALLMQDIHMSGYVKYKNVWLLRGTASL